MKQMNDPKMEGCKVPRIKRDPYDYTDANTIAETCKDRSTGKTYAKMVDGSIRRLSPTRPWHSKAERKYVLRHRRALREASK